jgi:release factor glutamine methyltransferase
MGTGSGCLLISTIKSLNDTPGKSATGMGLDISEEALMVARSNVKQHNLNNDIQLLRGSFSEISTVISRNEIETKNAPPFDVILCNPPYLSHSKKTLIDARPLEEEPSLALFAGPTGFECYLSVRDGIILAEADHPQEGFVVPGGLLIMEIGHGMAKKVRDIFEGRWLVDAENHGVFVDPADGKERRKRVPDGKKLVGWEFVDVVRDLRKLERCIVFRRIGRTL